MPAERRPSDDEEFERIVAGLELSVPPPDEPADERGDERADRRPDEDDLDPPRGVFQPRFSDPVERDVDDEDEDEDEDDDDPDGRFVPPEPGPAPPLDTASRIAWAGMVGGPAILVVATVIGYTMPRAVAGTLVLVAVASLVLLIVRRGNDDHNDRPDGGAVV